MKKGNLEASGKWIQQALNEKDPERKMHYFDLALELNPKDSTALNNKGMLLHKKGKFHEAIECYDRILNQYNMSKSVPALYNKSLALKELGRFEAALNFMNKVLKQQPDSQKIREHVENLTRIVEGKEETRSMVPPYIPAEKLAVNQIYDRWEPPAVSTLLAHALKCSQKDIKYYKGFGEDLIKEKLIQEKLSQKVYSCKSCKFRKDELCYHRDTKAMSISLSAICRNFRPKNKQE